MKPSNLTLTQSPNLTWRKKMKVLMLTFFAVALPYLAAAEKPFGCDYPPIVLDGNCIDWPFPASCNSDNTTEIPAIAVELVCSFVDRKYSKFYGGFRVATNRLFSDSIWTCFDYYIDTDSCGKINTQGDPNAPVEAHGYCEYRPDCMISFCGRNGQLLEERYQYWDGQQWIGEGVSDDPRINYAIDSTTYTRIIQFEFEFTSLDILDIESNCNGNRMTILPINIYAHQGQSYDIVNDWCRNYKYYVEGAEASTWFGVKTK
jgi:hypothetical protein